MGKKPAKTGNVIAGLHPGVRLAFLSEREGIEQMSFDSVSKVGTGVPDCI